MAVALEPDTLEELNGTIYLHNEAGEPEVNINSYHVIVEATTPGADNNFLYCANPSVGTGQLNAPINLTALEARTFLVDQFVYIREMCAIPVANINDVSLYEICLLRLLAYKHRLISPAINPHEYNVIYNDCKSSDVTVAGSLIARIRAHATYEAQRNALAQWMNHNRPYARMIINGFSNLVCTVAYVFRQKGHHYINGGDYAECYQRIWAKVDKANAPLHASWETRSTIALHAIMPSVLDGYWSLCVNESRIAPPLQLRYHVPAAGTAAVFALVVGWQDAKNVYGILLNNSDEAYQRLQTLHASCLINRWRHGINARYYGEDPTRLDMGPFSALAATVVGVYESAAENATLLQSKSLGREALSAPLQRDISSIAARAIKSIFVKGLTQKAIGAPPR